MLGRVLLVDDNEHTIFLHRRFLMKNMLSQSIKECYDGEEAYELLANITDPEEMPDVIFLDINMPVLNGWEFLEKYRQLPHILTHKPKVIVLSTTINPKDMEKALKIPEVKGFMTKPLAREKLVTLKMIS